MGRIVNSLIAIKEEGSHAASGYELRLYEQAEIYGEGATSGLWRIMHWRKGFDIIADSGIFRLMFGHGIGATLLLFPRKAHNDYLRIAIEQGIFGLFLNLAFFVIIFRRICQRYKYCLVAVALLFLSDNHFDNFLFMSLFIFFLASAQNKASLLPSHIDKTKA